MPAVYEISPKGPGGFQTRLYGDLGFNWKVGWFARFEENSHRDSLVEDAPRFAEFEGIVGDQFDADAQEVTQLSLQSNEFEQSRCLGELDQDV